MTGLIFDIQQFSVHDGPGIRTTVFFKGCNLRCAWCHNPESMKGSPELQIYPEKCIHCGRCLEICAIRCNSLDNNELHHAREACLACGDCAESCYAGCRQITGRSMHADEVLKVIQRDMPFYQRSGGGVTFSGGEPLLQHEFLLQLLQQSRERLLLHTAVDTAGHVPFAWYEKILPHVSLFLYDLKVMNDALHKEYTGVSNALILENLRKLAVGTHEIIIRIPVIPGVNDNADNMRQTAELLSDLKGIRLVELLPFHPLGESKYRSLGMKYPATAFGKLDKGRTLELADPFHALGLAVKAH